MKTEEQLRLQAYLDNEVSSSEARQIAAWIERDPEAKALYAELQATKKLLSPENEVGVTCPEGRDFYWSKIARAIETAEREPVRREVARPWWIRLLAPAAGAAVLALVLLTSISFNPTTAMHQVERSETDNSITFYSPEQKMTVVWIPSATESAEATTVNAVDQDIQ
jgi:anti-sigma factor RsiW